jgi:hypothetical protein
MRRRTATLLAGTILVLSATLSTGHAAATFGAPVVLSASNGYEPGIVAAPNGTLYVNEPGTQPFWRLKNEPGAKWQRIAFPSPYNRLPGGFDADAAVGHDGKVYYFDLSIVSNSLMRSDDEGATWTWGTPLSTVPADDRAWIAVGPKTLLGESVYALWADFATGYVNFARSEDSGVTFTKQGMAPGPASASGSTGKLVADDTGFVGFPYFGGGNVKFAYSLDRGDTWLTSQVTPFQGGYDVIQNVVKVGNTIHITWIDSNDFGVKYSRSDDLGKTWLGWPVSISEPGSNIYPWIAANGDKVSIAWYGSTQDPAAPTNPNNVAAATGWFVRYSESLDAGTTWSAPVDAYPTAVLKGDVCTQGISCDTNGRSAARALGDFIGMTIDANNHSVIVAGRHYKGTGLMVITQA